MTDMSAATGKARAARLAAIEQSGWGLPFRFLQPHNVAFWVYVVGIGGGALTMLRYFGPRADFYELSRAGGDDTDRVRHARAELVRLHGTT